MTWSFLLFLVKSLQLETFDFDNSKIFFLVETIDLFVFVCLECQISMDVTSILRIGNGYFIHV